MKKRRKVSARVLTSNELEKRAEARAFVETFEALNRLDHYGSQRRVIRSVLDALDLKLANITREQ